MGRMSIRVRQAVVIGLMVSPLVQAVAVTIPNQQCYKATCDVPKNQNKDPATRWAAAYADQVWSLAVQSWTKSKYGPDGTKLTFLNDVWNQFGEASSNCGVVDGSCDFSSEPCHDYRDLPKSGSALGYTPGAWEIRQSISHMHSFYESLWNAIGSASANVNNLMDTFVNDFAPPKPGPNLFDKLSGFVLEEAFTLFLGKLGGVISDKLKSDTAGDFVTSLGEQLHDFAKDKLSIPDPTQDEKAQGLKAILNPVISSYKDLVANYVETIENGNAGATGNTVSELYNVIKDGAWLEDHLQAIGNIPDMSSSLSSAFAASLLSSAWKLTDNVQPMILMENKDCDGGNPTTLMNNEVTHGTGSCAVSGKTFWLVAFSKQQCYQTKRDFIPGTPELIEREASEENPGTHELISRTGGVPLHYGPCSNPFDKLPGHDKLGDYGIKVDDIVSSAWAAYSANGNKNGGALGTGSVANGLSTAGLYQIPICEITSAIDKYENGGLKAGKEDLCDYGGW